MEKTAWNKDISSKLLDCICKNCGKGFKEYKSDIMAGNGKYCSRDCWKTEHKVWNKGLVGVQSGENAANWKGGLPNCKDCGSQLSQRHSKTEQCQMCFLNDPRTRELAANRLAEIDNTGENNHIWKGDDVGYSALHHWVTRQKGKATKCTFCQKEGTGKQIQWANKSQEYKRDLKDWLSLCVPCHKSYDRGKQKRLTEGRILV